MKNKLEVSGKTLVFPNDIEEIKKNNKYIFVRLAIVLNSPINTVDEECNVYAIKEDGEILWQIKNIAPVENPEFVCSPIVLMHVDEKERLFVTDFSGRRYRVNVETGEMEMIGITK